MARPKKDGLDYFPLDVDMDQDDKVLIIISKFGFEGFGILVKLLMEVYKNGYYYPWTEKEQIIFSNRVSVDINKVQEIVNECIKWGLFNENVYEQYETLTSKGIQERYLLATSRRVNADILEDLKLVSVDINSNSNEKESSESTQSKVKESKPKEKKEKHLDYVYLKPSEYERLVADYGKSVVDYKIDDLDTYLTNKGPNKFKDHNKTLRNWLKKDVPEQQPSKTNAPQKQDEDEHEKVLEQLGWK